MKTLYFDLGMGAAGDMLTAALIELMPEPEKFVEKLNGLNIPGVSFALEPSVKCGIKGSHMTVKANGEEEESVDEDVHEHGHDHNHGEHHHEHSHTHSEHHHEHHHSSMQDIEHIVRDHLNVSTKVKEDVLSVYRLIAEAESNVHGKLVSEIHFHEVGNMDAVADITAVCMAMEEIGADTVIASPVHVGSGHVRCAHGVLPVPAPATAFILKEIPMYGGKIQGELCTPTGAALLKHFVDKFEDMPIMKVSAIGYGMGKKDFEFANCVRVMLGETADNTDSVYELSCNLDDMTGEKVSFAMDRLFDAGALDVYTTAIGMKKSRPGVKLSVLCHEDKKELIAETIFKYTTTIGIRQVKMDRYTLSRSVEDIESEYGVIRKKTVSGYGVKRSKLEYDDLCKAALKQNVSLETIEKSIEVL